MNWSSILNVIVFLIEKILADDDKDGRPNLFDSNPTDPNEK